LGIIQIKFTRLFYLLFGYGLVNMVGGVGGDFSQTLSRWIERTVVTITMRIH